MDQYGGGGEGVSPHFYRFSKLFIILYKCDATCKLPNVNELHLHRKELFRDYKL